MAITPQFIGQTYEDTLTGDIYRANSLNEGDWTLICSPGSSCSNKEGSGIPSVVTPDFIGQTYIDTDTGNIWEAISLTIGDWDLICSAGSGGSNVQGAGDPSSVTPDFIGQVYKDTDTGNLWRASGFSPGAWDLELQNAQLSWTPTNVKLMEISAISLLGNTEVTNLVFNGVRSAGISVDTDFVMETLTSSTLETLDQAINAALLVTNCDLLSTINFPALTTVTQTIEVSIAPMLASIQFASLTSLTGIVFDDLSILSTVDLGSLTTISNLQIQNCPSLINLGLSQLVNAGGITITDNISLTDIALLSWVPVDGSSYSFQNNALNASTVNLILAQAVANAGYVSGGIDTTGGTNAAPSGQGIIDKATLQGRGVIVSTN